MSTTTRPPARSLPPPPPGPTGGGRLRGLVTTRREGTFVFYAVADSHVARLLADAVDHAAHDDPDVALAVAALTAATRRTAQRARR